MRTLDLSPLYRSTVDFDRLANMLDQVMSHDVSAPSYPPYNIEKTGDDTYRISIAVAGFGEEDLGIEIKEGTLTVTATKRRAENAPEVAYLHRGIAERGFERRFQLAEHVQVQGAKLENGLLHIDLVREVPEALKPRSIKIANGQGNPAIEA
ncbi:MAG: Hsp20 family protein [Pseudomonadota bacterium]